MTITHSEPTTNYASGRALLHEYDADHNGSISMSEMMKAIGDHKAGKITKEEVDYVTSCWKIGAGGIDKMCPDAPDPVPPRVCTEGAKRNPTTCWDGSVIYTQVCRNNAWALSGAKCPTKPPAKGTFETVYLASAAKRGVQLRQGGWLKNTGGTTATFRVDLYVGSSIVAKSNNVSLAPGAKALPLAVYTIPTTAPASITFTVKCVNVTTGSVDDTRVSVCAVAPPPRVCTEGAKRNPTTCWDGSVIYTQVCRNNAWASSGAKCSAKPPTKPLAKGTFETVYLASAAKRGVQLRQGGWLKNTGGTTATFRVDLYVGSSIVAKSNNVSLAPGAKALPLAVYTIPTTAPASITFTVKCVNVTTGSVDDTRVSVCAVAPPPRVCTEGAKRNPTTCWDGSVIYAEVCRNNAWASSGAKCPVEPANGAKRNPTTCWDGSVIYAEVYSVALHKWVPSGATCPTKICDEYSRRNPTTCWDDSVIYAEVCRNNAWASSGATCPTKPECNEGDKKAGYVCVAGKWKEAPVDPVPPVEPQRICEEGAKRNPTTCWNGSTIYDEVCIKNRWVPSGAKCPAEPVNFVKRNPTTCWDGSVVFAEVYDIELHKWVPSGATCPAKPECNEGDKKTGYVCVAGMWKEAVPLPGPAPVPDPGPAPVPPVVQPEGDLFTIEFQEMIPGIVPPRVPLLVPGMETLPLLPGWIVRDASGNIVNKGVELPKLSV